MNISLEQHADTARIFFGGWFFKSEFFNLLVGVKIHYNSTMSFQAIKWRFKAISRPVVCFINYLFIYLFIREKSICDFGKQQITSEQHISGCDLPAIAICVQPVLRQTIWETPDRPFCRLSCWNSFEYFCSLK